MSEDTPLEPARGLLASNLLLVLVLVTVLVVPLVTEDMHGVLFNVFYTAIYITAAFVIRRYRKPLLVLAVTIIAIEWLAFAVDLDAVSAVAGALNVAFFILIVVGLVVQIARTRTVDGRLIVESVNTYLLLGLMFGLLVALLAENQPHAYNAPNPEAVLGEPADRPSDYTYYAFVTLTTLGYGDISPISPPAESLAILIAITGQLYVAIIIAMLVSKLSSSPD